MDNKRYKANGSINPYQGTLYCAWTDDGQNGRIEFSYSTNQGGTWSGPIVLSDGSSGDNRGVNIKTGPNGEVYVCWRENAPETALAFASSPQGGNNISFSSQKIIQNISGASSQTLYGGSSMRLNSNPVMAVNELNGDVFLVWTQWTSNGLKVDMITSTDNGTSFSSPVQVGTPSNISSSLFNNQWQPWITCDETSGAIAVIYYAADFPMHVAAWVSYSYDEGQTWTDKLLSSIGWDGQSVPGYANNNGGDYLGIDIFAGQCVPVWSDNVSGSNISGCNGIGNMLAYTKPFSILCNQNTWSLCAATPNNYNVSDYAFYQSQQDITAGGTGCPKFTVQPSGYCTMQAANSITLGPGFDAKKGCYFHASISNTCPDENLNRMLGNNENDSNNGNNSETGSQIPSLSGSTIETIEKLNVIPNPTSGQFTVKLIKTNTGNPSGASPKAKDIYVYNDFGQLIYHTQTIEDADNINISSYPPGIYLLRVIDNGKAYSKKIIKQ